MMGGGIRWEGERKEIFHSMEMIYSYSEKLFKNLQSFKEKKTTLNISIEFFSLLFFSKAANTSSSYC